MKFTQKPQLDSLTTLLLVIEVEFLLTSLMLVADEVELLLTTLVLVADFCSKHYTAYGGL